MGLFSLGWMVGWPRDEFKTRLGRLRMLLWTAYLFATSLYSCVVDVILL